MWESRGIRKTRKWGRSWRVARARPTSASKPRTQLHCKGALEGWTWETCWTQWRPDDGFTARSLWNRCQCRCHSEWKSDTAVFLKITVPSDTVGLASSHEWEKSVQGNHMAFRGAVGMDQQSPILCQEAANEIQKSFAQNHSCDSHASGGRGSSWNKEMLLRSVGQRYPRPPDKAWAAKAGFLRITAESESSIWSSQEVKGVTPEKWDSISVGEDNQEEEG